MHLTCRERGQACGDPKVDDVRCRRSAVTPGLQSSAAIG